MAYLKIKPFLTALGFLAACPAVAQQSPNTTPEQQQERAAREIISMPWIENGQGSVGGVASIAASKQARILSGEPVAHFIQLSGNLPDPGATIVAPKDLSWFSIYDYNNVGYVSDKDPIDANALMSSLKEGQKEANAQRQRQGLDQLDLVDWAVMPHYDNTTHNLEWGLKLKSSNGYEYINYTTRHLGRGGYVSSVLVSSPDTFQKDLADFRLSDAELSFNSGSSYAEFRDGDKVAGYGLAALIVGGAGAAVVKSGAAKGIFAGVLVFWKLILAGVVAVFAGIAKFFRRLVGREQEE